MKKFNINDYMYIQITEDGWKHLENTVEKDYIKHCITAPCYTIIVNNQTWYRLQFHHVLELFPINTVGKILFETNV